MKRTLIMSAAMLAGLTLGGAALAHGMHGDDEHHRGMAQQQSGCAMMQADRHEQGHGGMHHGMMHGEHHAMHHEQGAQGCSMAQGSTPGARQKEQSKTDGAAR